MSYMAYMVEKAAVPSAFSLTFLPQSSQRNGRDHRELLFFSHHEDHEEHEEKSV